MGIFLVNLSIYVSMSTSTTVVYVKYTIVISLQDIRINIMMYSISFRIVISLFLGVVHFFKKFVQKDVT